MSYDNNSATLVIGVPENVLYQREIIVEKVERFNEISGEKYIKENKRFVHNWLGKTLVGELSYDFLSKLCESIGLFYSNNSIIGLVLESTSYQAEIKLSGITKTIDEVREILKSVGLDAEPKIYLMMGD